jgi:hypothetical protein
MATAATILVGSSDCRQQREGRRQLFLAVGIITLWRISARIIVVN